MDLKRVCRTCLLPSETLRSIFSTAQVPTLKLTELPILDLLKFFTQISVSPNDGLPDNICCDCLAKVHQFYTFKLKFENSESVLKNLKGEGKSANGLYEYEHIETNIELIKTENVEVYETSNDELIEQMSSPEIFEPGITRLAKLSIIQEVKQEPEIEINTEERDLNGTHTRREKYLKNDFRCSVCAKTFANKRNLQVHMVIHTEEKPFQCEVCEKQFRYKQTLKNHTQTAHAVGTANSTKFKCATCSKLFRSKYNLNLHMRIHTGEKPFQCDICPKRFRLKESLKVHKQMTHIEQKTDTGMFKCATCSKLFGRKSSLNQHTRIHTGEKPYKCDFCSIKFRLKYTLIQHRQTEHVDAVSTNRTKLTCSICSKLFGSKYNLKSHMKIHTGEKPFQCEMCPQKFRLKETLKVHVQMAHSDGTTDTRNFKCTKCSKLYVRKSSLNNHMKIHTGAKPFPCEICPKRFLYKHCLDVHLKKIHGAKSESSKVLGVQID